MSIGKATLMDGSSDVEGQSAIECEELYAKKSIAGIVRALGLKCICNAS